MNRTTQRSNLGRAMFAAGLVGLLAGGCAGEAECHNQSGLEICGNVGAHQYSVSVPGDGDVQWPPVALADGRLFLARGKGVVEIKADGDTREVTRFDNELSVLSQAPDGSLVALEAGGKTNVLAWSGKVDAAGKPVRSWQQVVAGTPAGAPVAIGGGMIAATTVDTVSWQATERITVLSPDGKDFRYSIPGVANPVVMDDGTLRVVSGRRPCGSHQELQARSADGKLLWTYEETMDRGIVDFSPGPGAVVYVVTEERRLRAIDRHGHVKWSFTADCEDCTVAAAPTVTHDRLYFPVWEGAQWACQAGAWGTEWGNDPLYSLRFDGSLEWVYDGFHTSRSVFQPQGLVPLSPAGAPVAKESTQHHPAGRPTVTADGTLYVGADGAMVALDRHGKEIGRVVMDPLLGETHKETGASHLGTTEIYDGGTQATPVLGADGRVYTFDGERVHAFQTGRKVASQPWIAPFGGATNAMQVH